MDCEPVIKIRNLTIEYHKGKKHQEVIKNVSLDFPKNKITMILGPSGCGKTTLLKSLNRLHDLSNQSIVKGNIFINGEDIYHPKHLVPELRRKVGLIEQKPTPLPFSIYKNVAIGPKTHNNISSIELDNIVKTSLKKVHLWDEVKDRLDSPAASLSLGQQQRLSIARAISVNPRVLLCDEITSSLDPISSEKIETELKDLSKEFSIIMVSHTIRQVKRLADYVIFIYLGKIIEYGTSDKFFNNPENNITRDYIKGVIS